MIICNCIKKGIMPILLKDNELTRHKRKENQRWKKKLGNGRMVLH